MDEIVSWVRAGDAIRVRQWLDDPRHDPTWTDDHRFSLLHWAAWEGHIGLADLLAARLGGANAVNFRNAGGDTPLHAAASHGHAQLVKRLLQLKAELEAVNEHGNTPLHYACFFNYPETALELLMAAASATGRSGEFALGRENRYGQTPIDLARPALANELKNAASSLGLDPSRRQAWQADSIAFARQQSQASNLSADCIADFLVVPPLSPNPTSTLTGPTTLLNRQISQQIDKQLRLIRPMLLTTQGPTPPGCGRSQLWLGVWLGDQSVAEAQVAVRVYRLSRRVSVDIAERVARLRRELALLAPRLRVFNCAQVQPLLASSVVEGGSSGGAEVDASALPQLTLVSGYLQLGSLYHLLHRPEQQGFELDTSRTVRIALDVANGMDYISRMDPPLSCYQLNSKSVVLDDNMTAKISLASCRFPVGPGAQRSSGSIHERQPAWLAPEALANPVGSFNSGAAHMWSFGVLLWELGTRLVPFANLLPMEIGLLIATRGLRLPAYALTLQQEAGMSSAMAGWMARLFAMATNELPGARPRFQALLPILGKIVTAAERSTTA